MELVNEALQGLIYYHMVLFSTFTYNEDSRQGFGYSFIALVAFVMIVNIAFAIYCTIRDTRNNKRLESLKKAYTKMIEEEIVPAKEAREALKGRKVSRREAAREYLKSKGQKGGVTMGKDMYGNSIVQSDSS